MPRASASASHPRRSRSAGMLDRYGLRSRIGVASSISMPRTRKRRPSRPSSSTVVSPIGLGRRGERVANTPCARLSQGGVPHNSNSPARSNTHSTMRCEKPSISVRPISNSGSISRMPSASCLAPKPLGISRVFLVKTANVADWLRRKHKRLSKIVCHNFNSKSFCKVDQTLNYRIQHRYNPSSEFGFNRLSTVSITDTAEPSFGNQLTFLNEVPPGEPDAGS